MSKRQLVLIALSSNPEKLERVDSRSEVRYLINNEPGVISELSEGLIWSSIFALAHLLPTHPSIGQLSRLLVAELQAKHHPIVRVYERWQVPSSLLAVGGLGQCGDHALLGWAGYQQRDVPSGLWFPWTMHAPASVIVQALGIKSKNNPWLHPNELVKVNVDGLIDRVDNVEGNEDRLFPEVYGRLAADQWIAWNEEEKTRALGPSPTGSTPFERTAITRLREKGGCHVKHSMYEWALPTPIGELRYSVSNNVIFMCFDDVEEAAKQLGDWRTNPYTGKWNHYALSPKARADEAVVIVDAIATQLATLVPPKNVERVWDGEVRDEDRSENDVVRRPRPKRGRRTARPCNADA